MQLHLSGLNHLPLLLVRRIPLELLAIALKQPRLLVDIVQSSPEPFVVPDKLTTSLVDIQITNPYL